MLWLVLLLWFSGQCWDKGWCKGSGERAESSSACGWEEKGGAVMVINTALMSSACEENPWGWCLCVQEGGVGWSSIVQLGLAEPQVSSLHHF